MRLLSLFLLGWIAFWTVLLPGVVAVAVAQQEISRALQSGDMDYYQRGWTCTEITGGTYTGPIALVPPGCQPQPSPKP